MTAYTLLRPVLFRLDPESAHALALSALRMAAPLLRAPRGRPVEAFGLRFPNRVGLAAGLNKNARALAGWQALGFGHVEIGTVTPRPQAGNPRPRVWRLPNEQALVNSMGFPSDGATNVASRLTQRPDELIIGGNIGPNADTPNGVIDQDCRQAASWLSPWVDYLTINLSSPNTPGLRDQQTPDRLANIVEAVQSVAHRPVLVKLSPDLSDDVLADLVAAAREIGVAGLVACNTTAAAQGGLSGRPLRRRSLRMTEVLANLAGDSLDIISVGGIATPQDVRDRLAAGAKLVQVYTALIYDGPSLVRRLVEAA